MDSLTVRLLDAVKQRHGLTSDYQLAKLLCMGTSGIYGYRAGRSQMSNDIALRVAAQLEQPAGAILAALAAERAKSTDERRAWCAGMRPQIRDMFGEVPVTHADVQAWTLAVAGIGADSPRFPAYVRGWDVPAKVRRAKLAGTFDQVTAGGSRLVTQRTADVVPARLRWRI